MLLPGWDQPLGCVGIKSTGGGYSTFGVLRQGKINPANYFVCCGDTKPVVRNCITGKSANMNPAIDFCGRKVTQKRKCPRAGLIPVIRSAALKAIICSPAGAALKVTPPPTTAANVSVSAANSVTRSRRGSQEDGWQGLLFPG